MRGSSQAASSLDDALEHCYRALGRREQTTAQLRRLLAARGVDDGLAETALAELQRQGAVDDARYAACFVHDRRELEGWGSERIRERLEAVGLDRELVETALGDDGARELEAAVALLRKRISAPPTADRERNRALGLLLRRGYDSDLAYEAVRRFEAGA